MNPTNRGLRERLLKVEQVTPALKQRYEQDIQAMFEQPLTGFRRWSWLVAAIGGLGFAVWFGTLAITMPAEFPLVGRLLFGAGVIFGIGWTILGVRVYRRGSLNLKVDTGMVAAMSWGLPVVLVTVFMIAAPNNIVGLRMILSGLVFLLIGAVFLIRHVIEQSQLTGREKLLEIEYRIAELAELLKPDGSGTPKA